MTTCLLGCQYLPCVEYFAHWSHYGKVTIEAHEHFQKRSWRNRTAIQARPIPMTLTVPLKQGKHQQMPIREVEIAYHEPWVHLHIISLQSTYGKTAFANEVLPGINQILEENHPLLWTLNLALLDFVISLMRGSFTYSFSDSFELNPNHTVDDKRNGIAAGHTSIPIDQIPAYQQVHLLNNPFQANLSILDVLCHLGPQSTDYVARYAAKLYPAT